MDEFIEQWSVKRPRCRALLSEPLRRQAEWLQSPGTALLSRTLPLGTVTAPFPGAFPEHGARQARPGQEAALRERGAKGLCTDENRINIETENVLTQREIHETHCMFVEKKGFPWRGRLRVFCRLRSI